MAAGYQDLYLEQGTTFTAQINLTDSYGVAYNLQSFIVSSQARTSYASANAAINFVPSIDANNAGVLTLTANSSVTANVVPNAMNKLVYDVLLTDTILGNVSRVLEGQIFVSPSVTRR